jgi:hypothetical protein
MPIITLPSVEFLCECFDYVPETGTLTWKARPREHFKSAHNWARWNTMFANTEAGSVNSRGYICVLINSRSYLLHRIVWKISTGDDPPSQLDHKDGTRTNNRLTNLRIATESEQMWNSGHRRDTVSGRRGVFPHGGKWRAAICVNGQRQHLGHFSTVEEASSAYESAARSAHGEFYRGR